MLNEDYKDILRALSVAMPPHCSPSLHNNKTGLNHPTSPPENRRGCLELTVHNPYDTRRAYTERYQTKTHHATHGCCPWKIAQGQSPLGTNSSHASHNTTPKHSPTYQRIPKHSLLSHQQDAYPTFFRAYTSGG